MPKVILGHHKLPVLQCKLALGQELLIVFCSSGVSFLRHTIGFNSVYDLADLEFTLANDEDFTAFFTLFAYDLPSLVPLPSQTQVKGVQNAPR